MISGTTNDLIEIFPTRISIDIRRYLSNHQRVQYVVTDLNDNYVISLRARPNYH